MTTLYSQMIVSYGSHVLPPFWCLDINDKEKHKTYAYINFNQNITGEVNQLLNAN